MYSRWGWNRGSFRIKVDTCFFEKKLCSIYQFDSYNGWIFDIHHEFWSVDMHACDSRNLRWALHFYHSHIYHRNHSSIIIELNGHFHTDILLFRCCISLFVLSDTFANTEPSRWLWADMVFGHRVSTYYVNYPISYAPFCFSLLNPEILLDASSEKISQITHQIDL